ncbi:hypothetical protein TSUD_238110 [Trifolium subterraneum]|uniref:RNase H type-1 domain-containing protein n=1 Tax=Trifolium subterraneum TaxID=3900 RepID=A0A2Z6ND47_TRISU|nr:hypothetical protein TSUD_238110 [Trifolium subterraneum]
MTKSEIVFSKHVPNHTKLDISHILPMNKVDQFSKYLGMPTHVGRSKRQVFDYVQDCVWKKIKGWKAQHLSFAGRSTLIKAVAQAIPTYVMSCFLLPKALCSHIESMIGKFWWGSNCEKRKIHWIRWSQICKHKKKGGLGFRELRAFNETLLAKQGWRCITQPNCMTTQILKAKYYPKKSFLEAEVGNKNVSYTWRSISKASWILKKRGLWNIGNGESIKIWNDNWLPRQHGHKIWTPKGEANQVWVKDLMIPELRYWNRQLIFDTFMHFEAEQIVQIPIVHLVSPDEFSWPCTKDVIYTVKSGYQAIQEWKENYNEQATSYKTNDNRVWQKLWQLKIPPKYTHLIWRILQDSLPVQKNLRKRGVNCYSLCPRCNDKIEDQNHVFSECWWAKQVWFASPLTLRFNQQAQSCLSEYQNQLKQASGRANRDARARSNNMDNWSPPPTNALKLNVDAHPLGDGRWGSRWIVRREDGRWVGAATKVVRGLTEATEAEAMGVVEAIRDASQVQQQTMIIETDNETIVKASSNRKYPRLLWGHLARLIRVSLDENPQFSVQWASRKKNVVAHSLACWVEFEPNKPPTLKAISKMI